MSSSYLRDYIERELENCLPNLNPETRSRLANIAEAFVNNQVSFNYALNVFTECSCPPSLITKFAHFKAVGGDPLPPPKLSQSLQNSIPQESCQQTSQESQSKIADIGSDQMHTFDKPTATQPGPSFPLESGRSDQFTLFKANAKPATNNGFEILNMNDNSIQNNFHNSFCLTKSYSRKKAAIWTEEEDMRLLTAVSRFGNHDWRMISAFVGSGRTSSQCNQRWTRALNPSISHHPWTPQEDQKLYELVSQMGECGWRKIASYLNGRTDLQCRHRYLQMKRTKEKEIQKENEMKMNSGNVISTSVIPSFRNMPISQEIISTEVTSNNNLSIINNNVNPSHQQNNFPQSSFCLPPQNIAPFVIVQNNIINYNYSVDNPNKVIVSDSNNSNITNLENGNSILNNCNSIIDNHQSPIKLNDDLFISAINGKQLSSSAISALPPLETISEIPFLRAPPLLFKRQNNNV